MPKENLVFEDGCAREPGSDQNVPRHQIKNPRVAVGWGKANRDNTDGHVSIRLSADLDIDHGSEGTFLPDADIRAVIGDRDDINKLIRTLRKARDQAFGQDA